MKYIISAVLLLCISCGTPTKNTKPNTNSTTKAEQPKETPKVDPSQDAPKETAPILPDGAVFGNFNGDATPFFAHVTNVNTAREITSIGFQNRRYPNLEVPKTVGGKVSKLKLDNDRDLLLFTAKIRDPNFNKYFLYVLRNNQWKLVMNGFAIHKSNHHETLDVIRVHPNNSNELLRNYSVFDIDPNSEEGYVWRLQEESVEKLAW